MVTKLVHAPVAVACLVLIASASSASAQSSYLAPISAPASSTCGDTAPDCAAICNTCRGSEGACQSSTPIGNYLRANCKGTCGLCGSPSKIPSTFMTAGAPSPSKGMQLPLAYGVRSATLSPSPCTFSCVDIPPPDSPFTCAEQGSFGNCNATFMVTSARGLPQGYCQITCGRCHGTSSCNSRLATPINLESIVLGMRIPVTASTPTETAPLSPLPATPAAIGFPTAIASPQTSGMPVQSTPTNSSPAVSASAPAGTSRSPNTGVPDISLPPSPSLQSASPTSGSPVVLLPTPSNELIPASTPFTAFSTLPPPVQAAGTNPASSSPAPTDLSPAADATPASFSNAVGQTPAGGPTTPAPSSTAPETAAGTPMAPSPTMLPPLFGVPGAYGSGSSPVQGYIQVPGVPPIQSLISVPAITNAETANPDTSPAQSVALPMLPASPTETPIAATNTPGTSAVVCFDIPPPQSSTSCAEQRDKCDAPFMVTSSPEAPSGYCQITCNRCNIPGSTETTGAAPATNLTPSPNMLSDSNETSSPVAESSLPSPSPLTSGAPGAANLLPQAPQTALSPSMTPPNSPSSPGRSIASSPSPMGSPSSSSATSPPAALPGDISNVPLLSEPVLPLSGALGAVNAPAAPPDSAVQLAVPTPGSLPPAAVNPGAPVGPPPVTPGECVDLQSDCKLVCQQMSNACAQPGGVGDYLRANCKQTCNLCPSSSPPNGCTKYTWLTGQWGVCNDTCGIGFHNRSVSCSIYGPSLSLQGEADAALCNAAVKPDNITTCIRLPCAADYSAACAVTAAPAASGRRLQGLMIL